ncbi:MAG: diheme cytochrome c [Geminocystis sp.]|nr:diheme cytochrome c [Geminocystis sp.]HIK37672.1 diheme cytochrome c family protein [Geminocystis sp. M7585_C2015_104]MCS7148772.1 diheme cytochrome c [Geminocystis sp.]MCX8078674.1 diheme cytochrome c [Geminocystis sp.]MDW8115390.1 diheme cytochrome c family protein [Geminocystis sp.]
MAIFGFKKRKVKTIILGVVVMLSILMGGVTAENLKGMNSQWQGGSQHKSVDKTSENFKTGESLYLQTCGSCHIAIPPAVLPTETWKTILENPNNHYGTKVVGMNRLTQLLMWQYLLHYSRGLLKDEPEPKFIAQSRYFFALHPQVEFTKPITHSGCIECHPRAKEYYYRVED